jgi:hypothetical protein
MAKAHSTGRPAARIPIHPSEPTESAALIQPAKLTAPSAAAGAIDQAELEQIQRSLSDAMALAETAYCVLDAAQEDTARIGDAVLTLRYGLDVLAIAYTTLDLAISRLR